MENASSFSVSSVSKVKGEENRAQTPIAQDKNAISKNCNINLETDSIGSADSILFDKKIFKNVTKCNGSTLTNNNSLDLDSEILVGDERELHFVCRSGNISVVERLLQSGVDVNCRNKHDRIPLHWAAGNGYLDIVKVLLDHGASIEAADKFGMDALLWSAWFGHKHCVQHLLHAGAKSSSSNKHGSTWIHCASQNNHFSVVALLTEEMEYFDINKVDELGKSALHLACKLGHKDLVIFLLKMGSNSSLKDKNKNTPLHLAAVGGHFELVSILVDAKCSVDNTNEYQLTPLHIAAKNGHLIFCEELIKKNADVNCETDDETCPMHLAVSAGHVDVCKLLLKHEADIDAGNKHNQTPLHLAVINGNVELTMVLVESGANCSVVDARSETPLHLAAENGLYDITEILLLGNSNHNIKDLKGKTPLDVAARGDYVTIVDMIIKSERYRHYLKKENSKYVNDFLTEVSFKPNNNSSSQHFRILLYQLASQQLKPIEWKQLAFYWGFKDSQLQAIEEQYTGKKSYREHGHRMFLIWLHGCILQKKNPTKELYEGLVGIQKRDLAEQIRTKAIRTNETKSCCIL